MIAQRALHITMNDQMCSDLESVVSTWLRPIVKAARIAEHTIKRSTFHADLNPIGKWTAGLSWGLGNRRPVPCTRWPRAVNEATNTAGRKMDMWCNEGEQFGSAFNLTAQR
jgi:hypothetical protein